MNQIYFFHSFFENLKFIKLIQEFSSLTKEINNYLNNIKYIFLTIR